MVLCNSYFPSDKNTLNAIAALERDFVFCQMAEMYNNQA